MYVCYNALLIFSSAFWAGTFARAVLLFYWKGLSTKEVCCLFFFFSSPQIIHQRQYLSGLMESQKTACKFFCWKEGYCHSHFLPVTQVAPAANIILSIEIKACFLGALQSSCRDSIIKQGKELAWQEVREKVQYHLKISDVKLTDNWTWNQNCIILSLTGSYSLHFNVVTSSQSTAQVVCPLSQLLGVPFPEVLRTCCHWLKLLVTLYDVGASSGKHPRQTKLPSSQWSDLESRPQNLAVSYK